MANSLFDGGTIGSIPSGIIKILMKISVSLPQELVMYIDNQVDNRSKLIESLLLSWQKRQQQDLMVAACLVLDNQQSTEEDEWQQAAITDWEASGW
jgi:metal-responsive CopG/Arc/MetJ family transcriptional regulator